MHISSPPIPKGHEHVSELVVGAECEATQTLLHDVIITNLVARLIGMVAYIWPRSSSKHTYLTTKPYHKYRTQKKMLVQCFLDHCSMLNET